MGYKFCISNSMGYKFCISNSRIQNTLNTLICILDCIIQNTIFFFWLDDKVEGSYDGVGERGRCHDGDARGGGYCDSGAEARSYRKSGFWRWGVTVTIEIGVEVVATKKKKRGTQWRRWRG